MGQRFLPKRENRKRIARPVAAATNLAIKNLSYRLGSPMTQLAIMPMAMEAVRVVWLFILKNQYVSYSTTFP